MYLLEVYIMNCPYCQNEMPFGYIPSWSQPVQWLPDGKRPSMFAFTLAKSGIPLINQYNLLKAHGYKAKAYYCQKCKIVLAHTQE